MSKTMFPVGVFFRERVEFALRGGASTTTASTFSCFWRTLLRLPGSFESGAGAAEVALWVALTGC
jgi:hypothetical protein